MADPGRADWKEVIIDHSQFPRRHGRIDKPSHEASGENPFCGDRVTLQLQTDAADTITDARFEATGCAISIASASLLAESLPGKSIGEAQSLFESVHECLTGEAMSGATGLGDLEALSLVRNYPSRVKCATLCWHALKGALAGSGNVASTE